MKQYIFLLLIGFCICSCQEEDIMQYKNDPRIYFYESKSEFSFIDLPTKAQEIVNIPVNITGLAADYDREVNVTVILDSNTTAPESSYTIKEGIIKANEYTGIVPIVLNKYEELDTSKVSLRLKLVSNKDFALGDTNSLKYDIKWTNMLVKPNNWGRLKWYFGTYSTSYYKFIMKVTGKSQFYYDPDNPDKEKWNWSNTKVKAYASMVKEALYDYNLHHIGQELKHDDGDKEGELVEMP